MKLTKLISDFNAQEKRLAKKNVPVATGKWGCGAFGGDPLLKFLIQWIAVSVTGRKKMIFYLFDDVSL